MERLVLISAYAFAILGLLVVAASAAHIAQVHRGRILLFLSALGLPVVFAAAGLVTAVKESSKASFCIECHEMQTYGKSLYADNPESLVSTHYQNRLVDRETSCFSCHTDYAMFGDVKAKINGLKHTWVHYVGDIPDKIELYKPYHNRNCLHCHEGARSYLDIDDHSDDLERLAKNERSCLECHGAAHDLKGQQQWTP